MERGRRVLGQEIDLPKNILFNLRTWAKPVLYTTALKNKAFFQHALQEYHRWLDQQKDKPGKGKKKQNEGETTKIDSHPSSREPPAAAKFKAKVLPSDAEVDAILEKHKDFFAKHRDKEAQKSRIKLFADGLTKGSFKAKEFSKLSHEEQYLHAVGHEFGAYFKMHVLKADGLHDTLVSDWVDSSASRGAQHVHGALSSMGVNGSPSPDDERSEYRMKDRENGKTKENVKEYLKEVAAWNQAVYKHVGLKDVTLFRGISGQGLDQEPPDKGQETIVKTRELSSFSSDAGLARSFGRVVKFKVPVTQVLWSYLSDPKFSRDGVGDSAYGEAEVTVMGASDLTGTIITRRYASDEED